MKYQPLSKENCVLLLKLTLAEMSAKEEEVSSKLEDIGKELPFLSQIVQKRIEVLKLPIKFTPLALLAINCFADRPGAAVLFLIDALNKFKFEDKPGSENPVVTVEMICTELYPLGFYTGDAMADRIDNEIIAKKDRFSYVY
jgi:hypothetical protein